ncbi:methionine-tRNA ligase [Plasmodium gonderi]|uniref:Methionine-tRNA ligase n=1 Tax=Plasmodium gonderi TaxID=77519 RepID=A0A1Y1JQD7_PLAGO|nr:methionine-tRNA ligase [Plasmodium gonderi]GAW82663.1 methionine-tRNA ligase [Plasmodium gonderi]
MCILTLVKDDIRSDILKLILDFVKSVVIKDDKKVVFPEIRYEKKISLESKDKIHRDMFCTLYAVIDIFDCYKELFNEDEGKVSENEEFIFNLASNKYILKQVDLKHMNDVLCEKSYLVSNKHASIADIFYFCCSYKQMNEMAAKERVELSCIHRWFLHIQETIIGNFTTLKKIDVRENLESMLHSKNILDTNERMNNFGIKERREDKKAKMANANFEYANAKYARGEAARDESAKYEYASAKNVRGENAIGENEKNSKQNKNVQKKKDEDPRSLDDITRLNIVVGYVEEVEIHPDADTLFCLRINVGEEKTRHICSGLRHKKNIEDLLNKYVLVLANLKEKSLRGKKSHGMVLCGSFNDKIELLKPPSGATIGERIICENMNVNELPDKALSFDKEKNPFFHIQPHLLLKNGIAYYKDAKLLSSKGEITCVLDQGTIS